MKELVAVDMFCGAGGESTGLVGACQKLGLKLRLSAINHWERAIETHSANHPFAEHFCEDVETLKPARIRERRVGLLWASPECTHHSNARGGRPRDEQSRATAWHVLKWAQELYIERIILENVPEFVNWGPLGANGKPIESMKGATFKAFCGALQSLGYTIEWRILNAADYGDPTTRRRFILQGVRGRKRIVWPEPTHSPKPDMFIQNRWRSARECIDWSIRGTSIFTRKKPLCDRTIARIAHGLRKFGGAAAEPFLVKLYGTSKTGSIHDPMPTVTGGGGHIGLVQPFTMLLNRHKDEPQAVDSPIRTITATSSDFALVHPFILPQHAGAPGDTTRALSIDDPMATVTCAGAHAVVEPFITRFNEGEERNQKLDAPLSTLDCSNRFGLVSPFVMQVNHDGDARLNDTNSPFPTLTTKRNHALIEPFFIKYNGTGGPRTIEEPIDAIPTHDRFGLVRPEDCDILFRMLEPHELAAAMGFPWDYIFKGTKTEVVKQIGNAVPRGLSEAVCIASLSA